ncbi:MAG: bifunctional riboflavin kinase/FAD synthetase [Kiritimatiellae bacterium]|jgi:riboflavin kinase/FMN adenylyltransferase|nr:bifunctional riboflavin kinase/FAD synthetase [Kiritimatiellia bacterium]
MKIFKEPSEFRDLPMPVVLAVGFFDGVHKGHQDVLKSAVERAREIGGQAWVMTFDKHPLSLLAPYKRPRLLCTNDERLDLFKQVGVDGVLLVQFTKEIAEQEPQDFVRWLCDKEPGSDEHSHLCEIRCGDNWRFGKQAAGTPELLARFGRHFGFRVVVVPYAGFKGVEISSTRIRFAISEGRLEEANQMLGRAYSVGGKVVCGRGVGNRLDMATANIIPDVDLLPPNGVYAVRIRANGQVYGGAANLGVRPTFKDTSPDEIVLETHLFDFNEELYGKEIKVYFISFLRKECKFDSAEELVRQVTLDVEQAKATFRRNQPELL